MTPLGILRTLLVLSSHLLAQGNAYSVENELFNNVSINVFSNGQCDVYKLVTRSKNLELK